MPDHTETSGRPLPTTINQDKNHPKASTTHSTSSTNHPKSSLPSDDCSQPSKPTTSHRRRPGTITKPPSGPYAGSSRSEQRSTTSPTNMMSQSPVFYTRTGRISKAKKGRKVHNCGCGRSYTRAEHLRRHQKNHAPDEALACEFPDCGRTFHRLDLLQRHQERHNEPGKDPNVVSPVGSPAPQLSPQVQAQPKFPASTQPQNQMYFPTNQPVSPHMHEPPTLPRYTSNPFRTPQIPRTPRLPSSGSLIRSSPTSRSNHKQLAHYMAHPRSVAVTVDGNGMTPPMSWVEPYNQSPSYSPSSCPASPNPGLGDYANVFANPPYGPGANRTRTSSIASYNDSWSYTPRSPTSSTTTYPWPNDKATTAHCLAYMDPTYPMTSLGMTGTIPTMTGYGPFSPKSMAQRDEDERIFLFPEQEYGMGQTAHTYPSEHYLNNYWRLFHPTFPVVHRSTYDNISQSPMLRAAMIALGGQYSTDTSVKKKSRQLHDRCIKLLEKRDLELMQEDPRMCDHQAVFLVEVLSQYRARRAGKSLSHRFGTLYHKAAENFRHVTSQLNELVLSLARHENENVTLTQWFQWIELATWQRLLVSCYILESQQATLLARKPLPSAFPGAGIDLPFPMHTSVWDSDTLNDWAATAQQYLSSPQYVFEVSQESIMPPCDHFQSAVLIAACYNSSNTASPYTNTPSEEEIDHVVDESFITKQKLLTAKLVQVTPIRALLAVSGESWILSEKVASPQDFTTLKNTLRTWVAQIWSANASQSQTAASKEALRLSIKILQLALNEQSEPFSLNMGTDMGVYFASLVLWTVTTAASTRIQGPQHAPHRHHSRSPNFFHPNSSISVPSTPTHMAKSFTSQPIMTPNPTHPTTVGLIHSQPTSPARRDSLAATTLLSHDQITFNSISFLPVILSLLSDDPQSQNQFDLSSLQAGCISMLLWVKLQLRGAPLEHQTDMAIWASSPGEGLGELLDSVVGSLERVLNRGWTGWGI